MQTHKIFLVDDHPLVREWLGNLLRQQQDLAVCGEAASVDAALAGIVESRPEVAIVDLSLANGWGLDLIRQLARQAPATRIIVLSMYDERLYAERTIRAGARGYVMKRETAKVIVGAIRQVLNDELYLGSELQAIFARNFVSGRSASVSPVATLSDRELEVFRLMGEGVPTREIAHSIGVSVKTVHTYHMRMREKLQVASLSELVREAVRWCESDARG
jgi:DNA-binding NarL/FixJ family response regulator